MCLERWEAETKGLDAISRFIEGDQEIRRILFSREFLLTF
jgi:hypothetical protein